MKKIYLFIIIMIIILPIIYLYSSKIDNNNNISKELAKIHYADIELILNGKTNDSGILENYKNVFLDSIKPHLNQNNIEDFTSNFESSINENIRREWSRIEKYQIVYYSIYDAIDLKEFNKLFSRAHEVTEKGEYYFVIVVAKSANGIEYTYINPYKLSNGKYYLDYVAYFKIQLIIDDFQVSLTGNEIEHLSKKNFKVEN